MLFKSANIKRKVEVHTLLLGNIFAECDYNENSDRLSLKVDHYWFGDPNMELELSKIIEEDVAEIRKVGNSDKKENPKYVGDFDNLEIYRIHIYEDRNPYLQIEYGFHQGDTEGVRLVNGYPHELGYNNSTKFWEVKKVYTDDYKISICW